AKFGLALMTPVDVRDTSRYYGVAAGADSVALVGVSGIDSLTITNPKVLIDGGTDATKPNRVVDFRGGNLDNDSSTTGFTRIQTGPASHVDLDASEQIIKASGTVNLSLLNGLVTLGGSVAIKITEQTVRLRNTSGPSS